MVTNEFRSCNNSILIDPKIIRNFKIIYATVHSNLQLKGSTNRIYSVFSVYLIGFGICIQYRFGFSMITSLLVVESMTKAMND